MFQRDSLMREGVFLVVLYGLILIYIEKSLVVHVSAFLWLSSRLCIALLLAHPPILQYYKTASSLFTMNKVLNV